MNLANVSRALRARCALLSAALLTSILVSGLLVSGVPRAAWADATNPALQMALGNPDRATAQPNNAAHFLVRRPQYALSYNERLRFPNWVSWHLSKSDIGEVQRGQFQPDPGLPRTFTPVTPSDYTRSGYDRGHNCPSKDRSRRVQDNDAVFLMSNITPQQHGMNAGPWALLEDYCRDLAGAGNELFITCGHGFSGRTHPTIGRAQVAVPDFGWKIVVVVPPGPGSALGRITAMTRVIAVRMPNISTISRRDWREFRTSVQDVEQTTGLRFFDALPGPVAGALKNRVDFDRSAPSRRNRRGGSGGTPVLSGASPGTETRPGGVPAALPASPGSVGALVWVNTKSGVYWRSGTRYYGKTKQGTYMSEADARKAGYRSAGGQ